MSNKHYKPLNEGYTGREYTQNGYTGSDSPRSEAPSTITIESGVVKPTIARPDTTSSTNQNK
jgi:hypothetical protein